MTKNDKGWSYEKMSAPSPPHVRISPSPVSRTTLSDLGVFRWAYIMHIVRHLTITYFDQFSVLLTPAIYLMAKCLLSRSHNLLSFIFSTVKIARKQGNWRSTSVHDGMPHILDLCVFYLPDITSILVTDDEDDQPSSPIGALIPGEGWQNTRVIKKLSWRPGLTSLIKLLDQRFYLAEEEKSCAGFGLTR